MAAPAPSRQKAEGDIGSCASLAARTAAPGVRARCRGEHAWAAGPAWGERGAGMGVRCVRGRGRECCRQSAARDGGAGPAPARPWQSPFPPPAPRQRIPLRSCRSGKPGGLPGDGSAPLPPRCPRAAAAAERKAAGIPTPDSRRSRRAPRSPSARSPPAPLALTGGDAAPSPSRTEPRERRRRCRGRGRCGGGAGRTSSPER